jgi:ribonuclease E
MAGLVVIDFIDMDHGSNVRKVEKAMKEALKNDRARIQVGRISPFGLMEMSRQRLRTGVLEASTVTCPHCEGTGLVRTASSSGLSALRLIEDEAARGRGSQITLRCSQEAAFYVLNKKRADIAEIEDRYGVTVEILSDGELEGARMSVEASGPPPAYAPKFAPIVEEVEDDIVEEIDEEEEEEIEAREPRERRERGPRDEAGDGEGGRKRRRRRRGRGRRREGENGEASEGVEAVERDEAEGEAAEPADSGEAEVVAADDTGEGRKRRRRGRRGGRRGAGEELNGEIEAVDAPAAEVEAAQEEAGIAGEPQPVIEAAEKAPAKPKRSRRKKADQATVEAPVTALDVATAEAGIAAEPQPEAEAPAKPKRARRKKAEVEAEAAPAAQPAAEVEADAPAAEEAPKPKRRSRAKAAAAPAEPEAVSQDLMPAREAAAEAEAAEPEATEAEAGEPRRGWWQRTFGA